MTIKQYVLQLKKTYKHQKDEFISSIPIDEVTGKTKKIKVFLFTNSQIYGFKVFTLTYYNTIKALSYQQWIRLFKAESERVIIKKILGSINTRKGTDYKPLKMYWSFPDDLYKLKGKKSVPVYKTAKKAKGK